MRRDLTGSDGWDHADRRTFLAALGALGVTGLAGCGGDDGTESPGATTEPMGTTEPVATTPATTEPPGTTAPGTTASGTSVFGDTPATLISFEGGATAEPGGTTTLTGIFENNYLFTVTDGEFTLGLPEGWSATASGNTFDSLDQQSERTVEWEITVPDDASGAAELTVTGSYRGPNGGVAEVSTTVSVTVFAPGDVPSDGLEAYFALDADTPVNVVTGTTAEVVGEPTTGVSGVVGSAYEFTMDGTTTDRAPGVADALVSGEDLPLNGAGATVGVWFRYAEHEPFSRVYQVGGGLGGGEGVGGIPGFEITFVGESDDIRIYNTDGDTGAIIGLTPDTWYFIVSVLDGDDARLHVFDSEGELDGSPVTGSAGRSQSDAEPLLMMAGDQADTTGRMDEVRAYSRALSESEVERLYGGSGGGG